MRGDKEIVTIRIFEGDKERLERYYPQLKYNRAIREIVKLHLDNLDKQFEQQIADKIKAPKAEAL